MKVPEKNLLLEPHFDKYSNDIEVIIGQILDQHVVLPAI